MIWYCCQGHSFAKDSGALMCYFTHTNVCERLRRPFKEAALQCKLLKGQYATNIFRGDVLMVMSLSRLFTIIQRHLTKM